MEEVYVLKGGFWSVLKIPKNWLLRHCHLGAISAHQQCAGPPDGQDLFKLRRREMTETAIPAIYTRTHTSRCGDVGWTHLLSFCDVVSQASRSGLSIAHQKTTIQSRLTLASHSRIRHSMLLCHNAVRPRERQMQSQTS